MQGDKLLYCRCVGHSNNVTFLSTGAVRGDELLYCRRAGHSNNVPFLATGAVQGDELLYCRQVDEGKCRLSVYSSPDHQLLHTLSAEVSDVGVSVASHPC